MYISKVEIKNYRNLKDISVDLTEKIILLGENGTGKSNFLEALRLMLDSSYRPILTENDFTQGMTKFKGTKIEVHVWFSGIDQEKDKDLLAACHDAHTQSSNGSITFQMSAVYQPRKDIEPEDAKNEDDYELIRYAGGNPDNKEGARRFREYVRLLVIPALRDMERDMQTWRTSPLRRLVELMGLVNNPDFKGVAEDVQKAAEKLQKISPIQALQKEIREVLGNIAEGGQSIDPMIGIAASQPEDLQRMLTFMVEMELPVDRTSLGLSNVLYLITWLVYLERLRQAPSKSGIKPEYVFLAIEEPEAHLHPHLQRLIFENALKNEHLLLVSTHSPTIVSISDSCHFVVLRRTQNGIKACSTTGFAARDVKMHKDVNRYLDATRGEMVFARGVLLVEGDAEMFLLPAFAKKMKESSNITHSLDGAGISVCNVYGTDFTPYVEFLKFLDIPFAVLTDGDPNNTVTGLKRGLDLAKKLNPTNLAEIETHFESQDLSAVRDGLAQAGIFVNEQTLEVELLNVGYENEFCNVYRELDASEKQEDNFRRLIQSKDFEEIIKRIETSGMGKGRFAQRLADRLNANRVPPYIERAIQYIMAKVSGRQPDAVKALPPLETAQLPEENIPF
jgi:putative ATP-dependent endonuclease of OLD family